MSETLIVFLAITFLFAAGLLARSFLRARVCVLCASVSGTWLVLLVLYWLGIFHNLTAIAVLMGGSATGLYYLAEKKTKEKMHIFRLPFFLTLVFIMYILAGVRAGLTQTGILLLILWVIFGLIFVSRENPRFRRFAERLIACCKNW